MFCQIIFLSRTLSSEGKRNSKTMHGCEQKLNMASCSDFTWDLVQQHHISNHVQNNKGANTVAAMIKASMLAINQVIFPQF